MGASTPSSGLLPGRADIRPERRGLWVGLVVAPMVALAVAVSAAIVERPSTEPQTPLVAGMVSERSSGSDPGAASGGGEPDTTVASEDDVPSPSAVLTPIDEASTEERADGEPGPADTIEGDSVHHRRGEAALNLISYPWRDRLPGWTVSFHPEKAGLYGLTLVTDRHIEIYVREDQSDHLLAHVVAHELGHAVDVSLNDGPDRRRWEEARELGGAPWWPGNAATDFSTGAGDFAESFAAWQVGTESFRSELGDPPDPAEVELLAELSSG